jgi:hypothetical protein
MLTGAERSAPVVFEEQAMITPIAAFFYPYVSYFEPSYFVGWGTLALINAGLAQGKHKSGLLWFLLSLLLGPLATLILVLLPKG